MLAASLTAAFAIAFGSVDPPALADIGPAPAVELTDQDGQPFNLDSLRGRAVLVSFIYTTCNGTCPETTRRLAGLQARLQDAQLWGRRIAFVSITLDPERDTPEALRQYAAFHKADPRAWRFLGGGPEQVKRVLDAWDMWAKTGADGVIDHPSRVFLIDPDGRIREIYNLDWLRADDVLEDLWSVL
jgi:protein SCO1/2